MVDTCFHLPKDAFVDLTTIEKLIVVMHRRGLTIARAARRWKLKPRSLYAWVQRTRTPEPETEARLKNIVTAEERRGFK